MTLSDIAPSPMATEALTLTLPVKDGSEAVPDQEPVLRQRVVNGTPSSLADDDDDKDVSNGAMDKPKETEQSVDENRGGDAKEDGLKVRPDSEMGVKVDTIQKQEENALKGLNIPQELPSVIDIKKALPAHCFVPNMWLSLYYMVKDFAIVTALYLLMEWSWRTLPLVTQLVITPTYWLVQGVLFTAIFVVGHDAGHESFSQSRVINDLCGNLCHSFLFCPFFMWKLTHRNHHKNTGNIDKEEVYYPIRESQATRFYNMMMPGFGLGIGWFTYLVQGYRPRKVDHFNPWEPMFKNHVMDCVISLGFLTGWLACLNQYWAWMGVVSLVYHWLVPTLVFGSFIVIITFLHHTDDEVPWYSDHLWNYVRGQLSSVDRNYGWCHDIIHNIGTHQIHHLFPKIPHYHLEEATTHFRKAFPDLIRINNERILPAFCRMFQKYIRQSIIKDNAEVHVYK